MSFKLFRLLRSVSHFCRFSLGDCLALHSSSGKLYVGRVQERPGGPTCRRTLSLTQGKTGLPRLVHFLELRAGNAHWWLRPRIVVGIPASRSFYFSAVLSGTTSEMRNLDLEGLTEQVPRLSSYQGAKYRVTWKILKIHKTAVAGISVEKKESKGQGADTSDTALPWAARENCAFGSLRASWRVSRPPRSKEIPLRILVSDSEMESFLLVGDFPLSLLSFSLVGADPMDAAIRAFKEAKLRSGQDPWRHLPMSVLLIGPKEIETLAAKLRSLAGCSVSWKEGSPLDGDQAARGLALGSLSADSNTPRWEPTLQSSDSLAHFLPRRTALFVAAFWLLVNGGLAMRAMTQSRWTESTHRQQESFVPMGKPMDMETNWASKEVLLTSYFEGAVTWSSFLKNGFRNLPARVRMSTMSLGQKIVLSNMPPPQVREPLEIAITLDAPGGDAASDVERTVKAMNANVGIEFPGTKLTVRQIKRNQAGGEQGIHFVLGGGKP